MSRLNIPTRDEAPEATHGVLDAIGKHLGFIPNLYRLMASSPAVLTGVTGLQRALSKTLDATTRHYISLAVSEVNACAYCVSAHSHVAGTFGKMPAAEIALAREGGSSDPKRAAAAQFAKRVTETRGKVTDADLASVRDAGYTDPQIIEIIALSVQFLLTNFVSNVAEAEIDFPESEAAVA
jgi:uncharacterized peroxidase-related enzyme